MLPKRGVQGIARWEAKPSEEPPREVKGEMKEVGRGSKRRNE
jgi:hypothetical protein